VSVGWRAVIDGLVREERSVGMGAYGVVGHEVVHVMTALPPADRQATAEVGDEHADQGVGDEVMGDAHVAGIVRGEHDLVPEQAEEDGGGHVPFAPQGDDEQGEEQRIA